MLGLSSLKKLFGGLTKTREDLTRRLVQALGGGGRIDEARLEAIEEALIAADVGAPAAARVVETVRQRARESETLTEEGLRRLVADELARSFDEVGGSIAAAPARPHVVLVVGVNGGGKTTTVAKLGARYRSEGRSVVLAAADTFRAAAVEQLVLWGERTGNPVIRNASGADPAAVVFDAARAAIGRGADVLLVDTAGRLHTKSNLMQELEKIARVAGREIPGAPHEVLLVLDATTGQNGLNQAREFTRSVPVTGLVLTKLDGTARGGVALAIARELKVPIRYVGVGEAVDDLLDFDAGAFVSSLLGDAAAGSAPEGTPQGAANNDVVPGPAGSAGSKG